MLKKILTVVGIFFGFVLLMTADYVVVNHLAGKSPLSIPQFFNFAQSPPIAIPSSISADCNQEVSGQINSFLAGVPNGSTVQFGRNACYWVDSPIKLIS